MANRYLAAVLGVATLLVALLFAGRASAHAVGLSSGEYTASGTTLRATLTFARGEVASLAPGIDENHDGHVSAAEVSSGRGLLETKVLRRVVVSSGGVPCTVAIADAALTEQDGLLITGKWTCPNSSGLLDVDMALLDDLAHGHRHVARTVVDGKAVHDEVLFRDHRAFQVARSEVGATDAPSSAAAAPRGSSAWAFFKMGVEHILTGYDNLVFLFGLVLLRARFRALLGVVTAFTVAHSITLAMAVLGIWAPSSRIVEPAIALSIAYVGIENFFVRDANKRWRITFPFGLIHGFGFASALQEIALVRSEIPTALVSFNVGVEVGQLGVMAVVLPAVFVLRDRQWFEPRGVRLLSGAIAAAGGVWFVSRVLS